MLFEFLAVFIWMLALYASIYSWRVKRSGDYQAEARTLLITASITVPTSLVIGRFEYFVMWYCLAALLALGCVLLYGFLADKRSYRMLSE